MGIEFQWDNDAQTVIRFVAAGSWNWNDFHKNMRRATFWLDSVSHPVEIIIDLRESAHLPAGALGHIRSLGKPIHPNATSRVMIIGLDESIARTLGGAEGVYHHAGREVHFADSDEAAQAIIQAWQGE